MKYCVFLALLARVACSAPALLRSRGSMSDLQSVDNFHQSFEVSSAPSSPVANRLSVMHEDSTRPNLRQGRSFQRTESNERYPSPHGKDSRWRFDLKHTVEAEPSRLSSSPSRDLSAHSMPSLQIFDGSSNLPFSPM
mmetsp:Transcript_67694/g.180985  ORF Transcript_67694/g.180985 Transcript_67694/m.180985 type:complete len:137 (+) Transcript_67694:330-740(+)